MTLPGGRRGVVRTLITAVLSTAAVFVATYCMHVLSIMRAFTETGWEVPGFFQMLSPAWQLIMDPETEMLGPAVRISASASFSTSSVCISSRIGAKKLILGLQNSGRSEISHIHFWRN